MIAYASGKAAISPPPPSTSQVSLPSQTGAIAFIAVSRSRPTSKRVNNMPMPRSNPSITTYIATANAMMNAQMIVRSSIAALPPHRGRDPGGADRRVRRIAFARRRRLGHQPQNIPDPGREGGDIDDDEPGERRGHRRRADRRHRIGGAQDTVDRPRLTPGLGRNPAGDHRDEPGRPH